MDRRDLLKLSGAALGATLLDGCARRDHAYIQQALERTAEIPGVAVWRPGVCGQCTAGCGLSVRVIDGAAKKLEGIPEHPTNRGGVCALGHSSLQELYHPDRILQPMRRTGEGARTLDDFAAATWEEALEALSRAVTAARASSPARVAVVCGEDGPTSALWSLFLHAVGAPPRIRDEPFDRQVEREAARRLLGESGLPRFDVGGADFVLGLGAAMVDRWRDPVGMARALADMRERGGRFVQAESRMSLTAASADRWLPVRPGTEGVLARALAARVLQAGRAERAATEQYGRFFPGPLPSLDEAAAQCDVDRRHLDRLAEDLLSAQRPLVVPGGSAALGHDGLRAVMAGLGLDLLLGAFDRRGGVFRREDDAWRRALAPAAPPAQSLAELRARLERGEVDVLVVADADPLHRAPAGWKMTELIARVPTMAAVTTLLDDTAIHAHWLLPAQSDLERYAAREAHHPTRRVISLAEPAVEARGSARHPADVALALAAAQSDLAAPVEWKGFDEAVGAGLETQALVSGTGRTARRAVREAAGKGFLEAFESREIEAAAGAASAPAGELEAVPAAPAAPWSGPADGELALVPFESVKDGDGRGGPRPWLQELPDPMSSAMWTTWVELASADAAALGVETGDWVRVSTAAGAFEAGVFASPVTRPGTVSVPLGQGHLAAGRYASGRGGNLAALIGTVEVDGVAAPVLHGIGVRVEKVERARRMAVLGRGLRGPEWIPRGYGAHGIRGSGGGHDPAGDKGDSA